MSIYILLAIIVTAFIVWSVYTGDVPKRYRIRSCTGRAWKKFHEGSSKEEIRSFLNIFTDAFAFSGKKKLKFLPEDQIIVIYRSIYTNSWGADALELETLANLIEEKYKIDFNTIWYEEMTLGELFLAVKSNA